MHTCGRIIVCEELMLGRGVSCRLLEVGRWALIEAQEAWEF